MEINQYGNLKATKSFRTVDIEQIFQNIRSNNIGTPKHKRIGNVFATRTNHGRQYKNIKDFTGLMFVDLDDCTDASFVKNIMKRLNVTRATWYSSSGNVHTLIKIPVCNTVDEYKRRFKAFAKAIEPYVGEYCKIDHITVIATQLAFESYDPNIYINSTALEFTYILPEPKPEPIKIYDFETNPTSSREKWIIDWIYKEIPFISHPGYTQLLGYSKSLGGYISGGYISKEVAWRHLEQAVNQNTYFNSRESSGSMATYQKGAIGSMEAGMNEPLCWDD